MFKESEILADVINGSPLTHNRKCLTADDLTSVRDATAYWQMLFLCIVLLTVEVLYCINNAPTLSRRDDVTCKYTKRRWILVGRVPQYLTDKSTKLSA